MKSIKDFLKNWEKVSILDMNNPEILGRIEELKLKQKQILKQKEVDINKLQNTYINI